MISPLKSSLLIFNAVDQCNHCRDLDLCRDVSLHNAWNVERRWACLMCDTRYDLDEIQLVLLEALKKRGVGHCVQDLRCVKCKQVSIGLKRLCLY